MKTNGIKNDRISTYILTSNYLNSTVEYFIYFCRVYIIKCHLLKCLHSSNFQSNLLLVKYLNVSIINLFTVFLILFSYFNYQTKLILFYFYFINK